jgi:hypothetical protein
MVAVPLELVELIIDYAWGCLSTISSHQHAQSMTRWMLVSHDWLKVVLSAVFRDLWITSYTHLEYILHICRTNSFICELAGITDIYLHLTQNCRSLTISVYHQFQDEYAEQCTELIEYAADDSHRERLLCDLDSYRIQSYAIPSRSIATFINNYTPRITALHFVLVDCAATYGAWDTSKPMIPALATREYPNSLVELHVTFAYTSPPPAVLMDAPRGTFFPPPSSRDMPPLCWFDGVRRLIVWDANADFVAFMTTVCPRLESVQSTAEFSREDVPRRVPAAVKDRLVFARLPRTVDWGLTGPKSSPPPLAIPVGKRRTPLWRFLAQLKHVLRQRN